MFAYNIYNMKSIDINVKYIVEDSSWCELCEVFLQIPVTHHMRILHPGCGKPAKGI